jgi:hypothetical protein
VMSVIFSKVLFCKFYMLWWFRQNVTITYAVYMVQTSWLRI